MKDYLASKVYYKNTFIRNIMNNGYTIFIMCGHVFGELDRFGPRPFIIKCENIINLALLFIFFPFEYNFNITISSQCVFYIGMCAFTCIFV
jgi:hypothetical protein